MRTETFRISTRGSRVIDLTDRVRAFARGSGDGLVHVFAPHATAGIALMETGSGSEEDLEDLLERDLPARRSLPASARERRARRRSPAAGVRVAVADGARRRRRAPARDLAVRRVRRPEPRERRADGAAELRRGLEVLAGRPVLRVGRPGRDRLHVAFAQQHEVLALQLDLEARATAGTARGRPSWPRARPGRPGSRRPTRAASVRASRWRGSAGRPRSSARRCRASARRDGRRSARSSPSRPGASCARLRGLRAPSSSGARRASRPSGRAWGECTERTRYMSGR